MSKATRGDPREGIRGQVLLTQGEIIELDASFVSSDFPGAIESSSQTGLAIVVSHDCDIDAAADRDPLVEFIPLKRVKKLDRAKTHTKSARSLQFEAKNNEVNRTEFFEAEAPSKFSLGKSLLWGQDFLRPYSIDSEQLLELVDWLSARYRRAALPNEFENRYKRIRGQFWDLVRNFNHELLAVLFLFDDGQENRDCKKAEPYVLSILLIHPGTEPTTSFEPLIQKIIDLFDSQYGADSHPEQAGIEIRHCTAMSEFVLPLAAYRRAIHHRIEWLSYESDPPGPVVGV
ncbi:MAG: hypothetical protein P4K93_03365 [Terracidiphilus sp.]|nr:hypothetical protein [Terracidiphilus sp.]MDR3797163.1 hypothetical protein [Terracidiphilus sp.]